MTFRIAIHSPAIAVAIAVAVAVPARARAEVKVDALIGDHMVVQRDRPVRLGGTAAPGEAVTATLAAAKAATKADARGRWTLALPALAAGGPFTLRISGANTGTNTLTFSDVLVGEVWVAAGQSNMELPLQRTRGGADAAALGCSGLRLFTVANRPAAAPATTVRGEWRACDAASAPAFSAAAFHFGRDLHRALGVPVGIVQSSVGGTPGEAWTPRETLRAEPALAPMVEALDRAMNDPGTRDDLAKKLAAWEAKNFYQDEENKGEKLGWARAGGGRWATTMQLPQLWENAGLAIDGAVWFRRDVTVPEAWAGKDLALSLGAIDDFDVTYWNGERVGATGAETPEYWSTARHYPVPARLVKAGRNVLAVRVFDHFGGGGFAGSPAQMNVRPAAAGADDAPLALAGAWTYKIERKLKPIVADWNTRPKMLGPDDQTSPTVLWNAMVAPFAGTSIAGVIWYQGESNVARAAQYRTLFPALIRGWRAAWGDAKLPFLFVQLPNFEDPAAAKPPLGESGWAELREAQAYALREPRTAMAVTLDIGEPHDVHPREKQEVGRRLALAALKMVYGRDVIASGPTFTAASRDGAAIKLRFANVAGGLTTSDGAPPRGFLIAGADRVWKPADARIEGGAVIVKSAEIAEPVAVRYGWGDNPEVTLRNQADLPAAPFRTDDWATASVTATAK